jgi:hypothetical protein
MEEEMDGLTNLKANLKILVEAVEDVVYDSGSVSVPMLQIDKVLDLQLLSEISRCIRTRYLTLLSRSCDNLSQGKGCQTRYNPRGFGGSLHRCQENGSQCTNCRMRELQQNRGNGSFSEVLQIAPH